MKGGSQAAMEVENVTLPRSVTRGITAAHDESTETG
jgi:hypothetical protein